MCTGECGGQKLAPAICLGPSTLVETGSHWDVSSKGLPISLGLHPVSLRDLYHHCLAGQVLYQLSHLSRCYCYCFLPPSVLFSVTHVFTVLVSYKRLFRILFSYLKESETHPLECPPVCLKRFYFSILEGCFCYRMLG